MSFYAVMDFLKKSESAGVLSPMSGDVLEAVRPLPSPLTPVVSLTDLVNSDMIVPLKSGLTVEKMSFRRSNSLASLARQISRLTELKPGTVEAILGTDSSEKATSADQPVNGGTDEPVDDTVSPPLAPLAPPADEVYTHVDTSAPEDEGKGDEIVENGVLPSVDNPGSPVVDGHVGEEEMDASASGGENSTAAGSTEQNEAESACDGDALAAGGGETVDPTADEEADDEEEEMDDDEEEEMDTTPGAAEDGATGSTPAPPMPPFPTGGPAPIEVVISFDTTGSMSAYLDAVRATLRETLERLFADIPWLRVGVLAHGDYCDETVYYLTKAVDFTNDLHGLCHFVGTVSGTGGGDWEECYELVLQQVREKFAWTSGTQRALIMIGDAVPHPPDSPENRAGLDWRQELQRLYQETGVRVYAVQCGHGNDATWFWEELAKMSGGAHLQLSELNTLVQAIMAICYREAGAINLQAFEHNVGLAGGHAGEMGAVFSALHGAPMAAAAATAPAPATAPAAAPAPAPGPSTTRRARPRVSAKARVLAKSKMARGARKVAPDGAKLAATPVAPSAAKKAAAALKKRILPRNNVIHHTPRELASEGAFKLNKLDWSPWKLAIAPSSATSCSGWLPRRPAAATPAGTDVGMRNTRLFRQSKDTPAIYELAVQRAPGTKRYVMYICCAGNIRGYHWDTRLLRSAYVNAQIDDVISKGCSVYIRRAAITKDSPYTIDGQRVPKHEDFTRLAKRLYSYAWCTRRTVKRGGVALATKP